VKERPSHQPLHIPLSSSGGFRSLVGIDLLAVFVIPDPRGRSTITAAFPRTDTNDLAVDGARNAVLELQVHLGDGVFFEDRCLADIANGSGLDHVANGESLDGLIFGAASGAIGATDGLDVAAALLVTTVGSSLLDHGRRLDSCCLLGNERERDSCRWAYLVVYG